MNAWDTRIMHDRLHDPRATTEETMKLYYHPGSTTSRVVTQYAAYDGVEMDMQVVDLFTGEQYKPTYASLNPSCMVPMLDDDGFRLTECSTIVRYLAEKRGSPAYPKGLRERARVHEMLDWFNTNLYRDLAYNLVYPQIFSFMKKRSDEAQQATLAAGKDKSQFWLKVLDQHLIGPGKPYVCGDAITVADFLGAEMIGAAEAIGTDFSDRPNIARWMSNMKAIPSWRQVHEAADGFAASLKGQAFVTP